MHFGSAQSTKMNVHSSRTESLVPSGNEIHSGVKMGNLTPQKLQEQWDQEVPVVPLTRLLKKNAPEWWMIALGLVGSMVSGAISPLFSIFFGRILGVFANPPDKVFPLVHPWAGLFLALAFVTALANLLKVIL